MGQTSDVWYLCIHGHFYQPPRENPWLEEIEEQESARPFHDWNERIHAESYLPNAMARVLDSKWQIVDIVNNFESISFNFGPTLLAWLVEKHSSTYQLILEADQKSREKHHGHGNAIAQAYNHMIMPLANYRDKVTQVKWGLDEFRHRFGREAESIWLPETACNEETLEVLVEAGIRFIVLEPHQAEAIRPLDAGDHAWESVEQGQIDPKRPYRCFLKKDPRKFIDIFFFDGPISKAVSFEDLLFDAKRFMDRIDMAKVADEQVNRFINIATDGETYGHHKHFGDRALAYLTNVEAPRRGYQLVNYAEYLDLQPPRYCVRLKEGENGEGTSWSCPHGVKRWKEHCGCRGDGPPEWNQHWRRPLRESLDWLRDQLAEIFETLGGSFLKDVWEARNAYISVILDRSEKNVEKFFSEHASRPLTRAEVITCLKLLEMQRHAMLMYTSCGWFFTEISGIETVQILQYAARAIQLAEELTGRRVEAEFLERLALAKSNVEEFKDGRGVYEKLVRPSIVTLQSLAGIYAIGATLDGFYPTEGELDLYAYRIKILHSRKECFGSLTVNFGRLQIVSKITFEEQDLLFMVAQIGTYDFRCSVKAFTGMSELEAIENELFKDLDSLHIVELLRKIDRFFGEKYWALKDIPLRERKRIISVLAKEALEKINAVHESLYDEHRRMSEIYRSINLPIPVGIRYAAEHTLSRRLLDAITTLAREGYNLKKARQVYRIIESAKSFGVTLQKIETAQFLSQDLLRKTEYLREALDEKEIIACLNICRLTKKMGAELDLREVQDSLFYLLKQISEEKKVPQETTAQTVEALMQFVQAIGINPAGFKEKFDQILKKRQLTG